MWVGLTQQTNNNKPRTQPGRKTWGCFPPSRNRLLLLKPRSFHSLPTPFLLKHYSRDYRIHATILSTDKHKIKTGETMKETQCPYCREEIKPEALTCKHCHTRLRLTKEE